MDLVAWTILSVVVVAFVRVRGRGMKEYVRGKGLGEREYRFGVKE